MGRLSPGRTAAGAAVLVTGGCGYVARPLVASLAADGRAVVVLDDLSTGAAEALPAGVHFVRGDVGDRSLVRDVFARWRPVAVCHCAAAALAEESIRDPLRYYRVNVTAGLALLEAVVEAGCPPFVFSSSAAVYGTPPAPRVSEDAPLRPVSPYGETKRAFEALLAWVGRAHGLRWAALRYFNAAGADGGPWRARQPETRLIPLALKAALGGPPLRIYGDDYPTPDGTAVRDFVHVLDLAEGHLAALRHLEADGDSGVFNLGSGCGHSVLEVVQAVESVTGRRVPRARAPRRPGDAPAVVADTGRAAEVLGWRPTRSGLSRLVADTWAAMRRAAGEVAG